MTARWATKYGPRRLRHEPPTLEEALFAAQGLADDAEQQVAIAAELMAVPVEDVRKDALRILKGTRNRMTITAGGRRGSLSGGTTTVVVERKPARRRIVAPGSAAGTAPIARRS